MHYARLKVRFYLFVIRHSPNTITRHSPAGHEPFTL